MVPWLIWPKRWNFLLQIDLQLWRWKVWQVKGVAPFRRMLNIVTWQQILSIFFVVFGKGGDGDCIPHFPLLRGDLDWRSWDVSYGQSVHEVFGMTKD